LVPQLAIAPRGWLLEHRDGLRSTILVLDGVVADYNFALRRRDGSIISAQLYRPPPPGEEHYSRLCSAIDSFGAEGNSIWPIARTSLITAILHEMQRVHGGA